MGLSVYFMVFCVVVISSLSRRLARVMPIRTVYPSEGINPSEYSRDGGFGDFLSRLTGQFKPYITALLGFGFVNNPA